VRSSPSFLAPVGRGKAKKINQVLAHRKGSKGECEVKGEGENTPSANADTPLKEGNMPKHRKGVNQPSHIESVAEKSVR